MTKEDILNLCKSNKNYNKESVFKKCFPEQYAFIMSMRFPNNFKFQQKLYHWIYGTDMPVCKTCGKPVEFLNIALGYRRHCSNSCSRKDKDTQLKQKITNKEKHGNENYNNREQALKTWRHTYFEHKDEIIRKHKKTCLEKHGDENYRNDEQIQKTSIEKYGTNRFTKTKLFVDKTRKTKESRYGDSGYTNREKCELTMISKYGVRYSCMLPQSRNQSNNSKPNSDFANLLIQNNISFEREFVLNNYVYDFKINNILIEINPTSTHNTHMNIFGKRVLDKNYHLNKTNNAKKNGYSCIHLFDWHDKNKVIEFLNGDKSVYSGYIDKSGLIIFDNSKPVVFDYENNEYVLYKIVDPILHWFNQKKKEHICISNFNYDEMISNGYLPVYDCGQLVYKKD